MTLAESGDRMTSYTCKPDVCEACGSEFSCGATLDGCWCGEVKLCDDGRAALRTRYERCLCRACLEKQMTEARDASGVGRATES